MQKYWLVFFSSVQDVLTYRADLFLSTFKYAGMVLMMTFVWLAVESSNPGSTFSRSETINYFVFSALLYSLSNMHTWYIEEDIRLGFLTKFLVKPVSPLTYYLSFETAKVLVETLMKIVVFIPALLIFTVWTPPSLMHFLLAFAFMPVIFLFSFTYMSLISIGTFWLTEIYSLRWAITSTNRFLAGTLIPISFFPLAYQNISFFLPFQHLAYTPIRLLQGQMSLATGVQSLGILLFWLCVLFFLRAFAWRKGLEHFEGTGL
ncbi:MAG: ABC-2 family transporter protein [Microgenomates group bacterium]